MKARWAQVLVSIAMIVSGLGCQTVEERDSSNQQPVKLVLQPFGQVPKRSVEGVREALKNSFNCEVQIAATIPLPQSAYTKPRNRYRAEKILDFLVERSNGEIILGLTSSDISTTKEDVADWGIFGLGRMPGKAAVISTFRLSRPGKISPQTRLERVAVHEIGHTLGLPHCPTVSCLMEDAKGSIKTVDGETEFCRDCLRKLGARSRKLKR